MIKAVPEDFIVEEKAELPLRPKGEHRVYLLQKSHWNTLDLIHFLSRTLNLSLNIFSSGGKKDKHGLTYQFIAIRHQKDFSQEGKGFSLTFQGFMNRPMGPDLIAGNAFTVTLRNLNDVEPFQRNLEAVKTAGFPNFFDDQRFRSYDPERGFFAEKILHRHWNGALQVFLTSAGHEAGKKEGERKEAIFRNWKDWESCLGLADNPQEKKIFSYLKDHPKDSIRALHMIPEEEVSMQYSAFQSHLWNDLLRRVIKLKVPESDEIKGAEGSYLFWNSLEDEVFSYLRGLKIPTAALKMEFADELTRSLFEEILKEKNLKFNSFRTKALRKAYFRSFDRQALVIPGNLRLVSAGDDELHPGKKKVVLAFFLPRGSYGTMLIKRLSLPPGGQSFDEIGSVVL